MFSKQRAAKQQQQHHQQQQQQQQTTGSGRDGDASGLGIQPEPAVSSSTAASNAPIIGNALHLNFDFELPTSPDLTSSPSFESSFEGARPQTSGGQIERIPPPPRMPAAREESDNVSTSSSASSNRKSRMKSFLGLDSTPDSWSFSRPWSATGPKMAEDGAPTSADCTPKMEPSLFPSTEFSSPPSRTSDTPLPMSRAWIDSRDKPYAAPPARFSPLQSRESTPDFHAATHSPNHLSSPSPHSANPRQTSFTRPSPQSLNTSPTALQRPPSHAPTNYSSSTAWSNNSSMSPATESPENPALTLGTPYKENSPSFPLPHHVATRPQTAGSPTAAMGGMAVPTHHTSSPLQSETSPQTSHPPENPKPEKSERRKTRLLNPMALLTRRRTGQEDEAEKTAQAAQAQALQRQKNVAAVGVSKLPEDFDPRIKGKVVHDFSAPRKSGRNFSSNDVETSSSRQRQSRIQSASSAPFIPAFQDERAHSGQSSHSNKNSADGSSRRSLHTGLFTEHLGDTSEAASGRIQAERLENKDFLQRMSHLSHTSNVSQESAVLPPFARRSQTIDPQQIPYLNENESKRSSDQSSGKAENRDSQGSSFSSVSPVTARNSGLANDNSAGLSPVSPASPDKRGSHLLSEALKPNSSKTGKRPVSNTSLKGDSTNDKSSSEGPSSGAASSSKPDVEHLVKAKGSTRPTLTMSIPQPSPPARAPPEVPPRVVPSVSPLNSPGPSSGANSHAVSRIPSPAMSPPAEHPTPEQQITEPIEVKTHTTPPKLAEKRADAVGHGKRTNSSNSSAPNLPKHHESNASRFSFQFGGSAAEERALEDKHRKKAADGQGGENASDDEDDEDDFFDEDAMDDMDEMEAQDSQGPVLSLQQQVQLLRGRPPQGETARNVDSGSLSKDVTSASQFTAPDMDREKDNRASVDRYADGAESESDSEAPYWMYDYFQGDDAPDFLSTDSSPPPENARLASQSEQQSRVPSEQLKVDTDAAEKTRSAFYMQPAAAGYSPDVAASTNDMDQSVTGRQPTHRGSQSSNDAHNDFLSGLSFTSTTIDEESRMTHHNAAQSHSTVDSSMPASRPFSQSTVGSSSSAGPRTHSTGLGIGGFGGFKFTDSAPPTRPTSLQQGEQEAKNKRWRDSETIPDYVDWTNDDLDSLEPSPSVQQGDPFASSGVPIDGSTGVGPQSAQLSGVKQADIIEDDDMYFDDGGFDQDFGSGPTAQGEVFDESAFDDDNFLNRNPHEADQPPQQPQGPPPMQPSHQRDLSGLSVASLGSDGPYPSFARPNPEKARDRESRLLLEDLPLHGRPVDPALIPRRNPSEDAKRLGLSSKAPPLPARAGSLEAAQRVQTNLQAYHAALANAANKAASDGRFARQPSVASTARSLSHYSKTESDDWSLYSQDNHGEEVPSYQTESWDNSGLENEAPARIDRNPPRLNFDFGFDTAPLNDDAAEDNYYDDLENDDDIVAAANAEVLASDDEGFYGHEFGFFAKARPNSGEIEAVNGGFFGLDGDDGLTRNKSLKEPNLTPITERSEFSTRNSFIGMGVGGFPPPSAGGGVSPALARMPFSPLGENEVTSFDQLRKLRAHAFGGSNSSLQTDHRNSLPLPSSDSPSDSARSSAAAQGYFGPLGGAPMTFAYSTDSSSPGPVDDGTTPRKPPPQEPPLTARKIPPQHSRKSSDSVTYVKEQDPGGPPRWVLERRRASELGGQLELVGREVVSGGWI